MCNYIKLAKQPTAMQKKPEHKIDALKRKWSSTKGGIDICKIIMGMG
jgi:hypothetical protein